MQVHVSQKHRSLGVPANAEIRNLFPDAKEIDFNSAPHLVLPHGTAETFLLRRLGFEVPAPIESQYEWPHPSGQPPFNAQIKTASLLTLNPRAYVLNDMGTGKTRSVLWAWDYLRGNNLCKKALIVAPLSTLNFTWAREVFATLPHRTCGVVHGSRAIRKVRLADNGIELFIINHDGIKTVLPEIEALIAAGELDVLIIDELAVYRNGGAQRTKDMRKLASKFKWVWGMTGAPIPHEPTDAWAQCTIVTPNTVPKYFGRFRDELMTKLNQFKYVPKPDAVSRAFAVMQPAVRFTLDDVVELPECIERTVDVELGPKQRNVYKQLAEHCFVAVQNKQITAANAGAVLMKLLQVSTGWVYAGSDGHVVSLDNGNRLDALMDAINATSRKVLVFAPFKHALAGISERLTAENIDHAVVSGDTSAAERNQIFNLFQNTSKYRVLVAHPQCLAHGITLTAADTIVWFAPVTSLEIYDQANRRIRRVGQKHKQLVLHLQSTPVEKKIYSMLRNAQKIQDQLLELFEEASRLAA